MAANAGKFKDTTPIIRPAGKDSGRKETMKQILEIYPTDDAIEAIMHEGGLKKLEVEYKRQRMENIRHEGVHEKISTIMGGPVETRYQTLLKDLRETVLESYWNKEVGKVRDPIGGLPGGLDLVFTTFGKKLERGTSAKDIINPNRSRYEILHETNEYHPMYRKSHNQYYPGEHINRNYEQPAFNPNKKFGKATHCDRQGNCLKYILKMKSSEPITFANQVLANHVERTHFQMGKCLTPNNNINFVPEGFRFGVPTPSKLYGVQELLKPDIKPSLIEYDYITALGNLNKVRNSLKKKETNFLKLNNYLKNYDKDSTGVLPFEVFYKILNDHKIVFDHKPITYLADLWGIYQEGQVIYTAFLNLFNHNVLIPDLGRFYDNNNYDKYFISSYKAFENGKNTMDNSNMRRAGLPSRRLDSSRPMKPPPSLRCDIEVLGDDSSCSTQLNPSIFTNYAVTQLDFWQPRTQETMKQIFKNLGYNISDEVFEELWKIGLQIDKTGKVCVDTFNYLVKQTTPFEMKVPPPEECIIEKEI